MLTRFDKTPFRQAHRKIIDTLMSCDNETQFVTTTHMVNNFINWVNFYVDKWHVSQWFQPWDFCDYNSWHKEVGLLIEDINKHVQQMYDFVETKHQEEAAKEKEQAEIAYQVALKKACEPKYPKQVVIQGFGAPAKKTKKNNG